MKNRRYWMVAIALATLIGLTLFVPRNGTLQQGSTYSRAPNGYGAWYAYLEEQGIPVRRWQRPPEELGLATEDPSSDTTAPPETRPITFVQINPVPRLPSPIEQEWARAGHRVVVVGIQTPVTAAPFSSLLESAQGGVRVETRRRYPEALNPENRLLEDSEGSVAWKQTIGDGEVIYINTPNLAANAYQNEAGNIPFLAALVAEPGHPVWVDEYLHGYRDPDILAEEKRGNAFAYLMRTPVMLVAIQALVLLLLVVWGDRRLGPPLRLESPKTDSNATYIGALGSVLNKAGSSEFVMETVGRHEQEQIQRSLGLGVDPVESEQLLEAWTRQTGQSPAELQSLLKPIAQKRRLRERELLLWLENLRQVRRHLP